MGCLDLIMGGRILTTYLNMDHYDQIYTRQIKKTVSDGGVIDLDSMRLFFTKLKNGTLGVQDVDDDYVCYLDSLIEDEQEKDIRCEYQSECEKENEREDVHVDVDVDENDKDPQYCMFLENLTEHGKSYKLKISQNDEKPSFLYYEEQENSDWCDELQTCADSSGDELSEDLQINHKAKRRLNEKNRVISTKKEVSRRKKIDDHKSTQPHQGMISDSCYQIYLNSCVASELVAVKPEENLVEYEKNVSTSGSDSDIMILDDVQNCSEVNNKQIVVAEKEPSLREKLMHILRQPYNEKEYEELSDNIEQKKPMGRHLDLRCRPISSAFGGVEKSLLDNGPGSFRRMLRAARNDPPNALNLLRMFFFWLEHVPNENAFVPWRDKYILKVRPSEKNALQS